MFENALVALDALFDPIRLAALFAGMIVGMIFGMLPGLGGVAAVSILLPFVYYLDDYSGLAMLLGAVSVVYTSDTITSVLLGAPGSPASAPTAIEGHALAKQGQAARALGVGFLASMVGGLVGALILFVAIPVAGPIVLLLSTPELFMFALVGLFFASSMIGKDLAKGLAAACLGMLLGVVGPAQAAADFRFTFGQVYLLDGFSLTIVALGLFGVAEVISMLAAGGGISHERMKVAQWGEGFRDFWRHKWLVLRAAFIGVLGGFVPAVGASASTWVAYGHSIRSAKDKSKFGKGEIRGIAASEGANNATVISDLVPTLLFSVPGGPAAAIFLGALFSFGYYPGPRMITQHPDLMFLIVWSVALTSVVGAALCFAITPALARLTRIPFAIIAAPLVLIMIIGAYQSTSTMGDIFMLFTLGALGWLMKHGGWPRAPALVGFVLSGPMEQYFWLANQIHGWSWLTRPGVLLIGSVIVIPLILSAVRWARTRARPAANAPKEEEVPAPEANRGIALVLAGIASLMFAYAMWEMFTFNPASRLMPSLAILPGLPLALWLVIRGIREYENDFARDAGELTVLAALIAYAIAVWAIGLSIPTIALLAWMLFYRARMRLWTAAIYGSVVFVIVRLLFDLLRGDAPVGALLSIS
ncbi:tripartite tricarboxylate transporter permease [Ovoidimarina sediminis]|uniref:tripartite tricarboxylate transporter permease n=1 Tax=Ovoidimarina sediminis TaxID=3079856 RepID=UPI00290E67B5|nr:tripartite tricarboxylate transporter permease [Rhodophyticola sp. MJ-SS7]MDU8944012.1 tripartite tricarboxylate transporter permease [Rhodophyticola sp. MJ-SS7]